MYQKSPFPVTSQEIVLDQWQSHLQGREKFLGPLGPLLPTQLNINPSMHE